MLSTAKTQGKPDYGAPSGNITMTNEGVLLIDLKGAATRAGLVQARRQIQEAEWEGARAFVVRADRALIALGSDCLASFGSDTASRVPGALVVPETALQIVQDYALRMAEGGIVRMVFTARDAALVWATRQARLARAQALWARARP